MNNGIGSSFDDLLKEEGLLKEAKDVALKRVIEYQKKKILIRKMIKSYTKDIEEKLFSIGISSIEDFLLKKDDLLQSNFHKTDDIINLYSSIKKLKSVLPEFNSEQITVESIDQDFGKCINNNFVSLLDQVTIVKSKNNLNTEDILNELLKDQKNKKNYVSRTLQSFGILNKEIIASSLNIKIKKQTMKLYLNYFEENSKKSNLINNELTFFLNLLNKRHKIYISKV